MRLENPVEFVVGSSNAVMGMHLSSGALVRAFYFDPGFLLDRITYDESLQGPRLEERIGFVGQSGHVGFDGGSYVELLEIARDEKGRTILPRAQVGQLDANKILHYTGNGDTVIRRLDMSEKPYTMLDPLESLQGPRGEYFTLLEDGSVLSVENFNVANLRLYGVEDATLTLQSQIQVPTFTYGLAQEREGEIIFVVPKQGTYSHASNGTPGVYRVAIQDGQLQHPIRDTSFDAIDFPMDARGFAALKDDQGDVKGYLVSTYGHNRELPNCGDPSRLFWIAKQ